MLKITFKNLKEGNPNSKNFGHPVTVTIGANLISMKQLAKVTNRALDFAVRILKS